MDEDDEGRASLAQILFWLAVFSGHVLWCAWKHSKGLPPTP